eukprot:2885443-Pyramimonas_sp.AAC.1
MVTAGTKSRQAPTAPYGTLFASRVFAWGQNRIHLYQEAGFNPKMLLLRGSELCHRGEHPEHDN